MLSRVPFVRCGLLAVVTFLLIAALLCVRPELSPSSESLLQTARLRLAAGDHQQAERLASQAATKWNPSPWALIVASEAALRTNRYADALAYYKRVPRTSKEVASSADFGEAEMLCHLGRISESEAQLRQLLARDPQHGLAHYRLAFLLNITARRWEAQPHLLHLIRNRLGNEEHLLLLGNSQRLIEDQELLKSTARVSPDDPLPVLGAARMALAMNRRDEARRLLDVVRSKLPNEPEVVVRWGQFLLDENDPNEFINWSLSLTPNGEQHPEVWMLRGQFAQRLGQLQTAARCFWEASRRDPENLAACHQLGRTLTDLNDADQATPFLARAELLQRLSSVLDDLFHHRDHIESMHRAAMLAEELGRIWETVSWASVALSVNPRLEWAHRVIQELAPRLQPDLGQTLREVDPSRRIDLSSFPLPNWTTRSNSKSLSPIAREDGGDIQFVDKALQTGIDFRYENCGDETTPGARIFETTGGGVGVIDFDVDGWPDLYFTQGGVEPHFGRTISAGSDNELIDRLYRNMSNGRFLDCTHAAGLGDPDFSQGVAVGDIDNDGFPDLYVANFGRNRLYLNQGDGTFVDITETAGLSGESWTTSCLIADLNGDGLPDLYDVNYVAGDSVLTRLCERQGVTRSCSPRAFDPAPDQVWLNEGTGRFRDVTAESGVSVPNGYGLGIVAADFDGTGRLNLFVANDEVPNFLFVHDGSVGSPVLRFQERALVAGVAVDANGMSQACMGVACGDADGDGMLDLYVTNFYQESNTLYRQIAIGQFADVTRTARLRDASFAMLGFGCQFLDADLDGWEDLAVTNGHIDNLTSIGEPYKMPSQIYRNLGRGTFTEVLAKSLGSFFEQNHLGRGLARLDWNRDGRDEFAISHIGEPAALLVNTTRSTGHYMAIRLRGTDCSRDAIGATIQLTVGNRRFLKQLTAGDGYQASNERQLIFGLGQNELVDELQVRWPGGAVDSWKNLASDQTVLIVERASKIWTLAKPQ